MSASEDALFMERLVPCQSRLYRFIASLVPNRADAEDLFQKTSLSAWEERSRYDPSRELFLWICGIARNHIRHYYRSRKLEPASLAPDVVEQLSELGLADRARDEDRQKALEQCLRKLPPKERELLETYYGGHRTVRQVAESLGRTLEAVFKALQRTRSLLQECIASRLSGGTSP